MPLWCNIYVSGHCHMVAMLSRKDGGDMYTNNKTVVHTRWLFALIFDMYMTHLFT